MKALTRLGIGLLMLVLMLSMIFSTAFAATDTHNGLELTLTTDKTEYAADEAITAYVTLVNKGLDSAKNIVMTVSGPANYTPAPGSDAVKNISILRQDGMTEMETLLQAFDLPSTGDSSNIAMWAATLVLSGGLGAFLLSNRKRAKQLLVFVLVTSFALSGVTFPVATTAQAASGNHEFSFEVKEGITVGGMPENVTVTVTYEMDGTAGVTREEWLSELLKVLKIETQNVDVTFDDYEKAVNAKLVQTGINMGIMPTEIDRDYVQLARPDELADRDFLAFTAQQALQMSYEGEERFECIDTSSLKHPEAARMAVELGMLELIDGFFYPSRSVTDAEVNQSIKAIKKLLDSTDVNVDDVDYVDYADDVTEITLAFTADTEDMIITVENADEVRGLKVGKIYILHSTRADQQDLAIRVQSVSTRGGKATIRYTQPELHEVMKSFNLTGMTNEGGYFIPAEGVEMVDTQTRSISRATVQDELPLWGAKTFKLVRDDVTYSGTLDVKSLEYRFSASPTWRFPFLSIDEVYAALNVNVTVSASHTLASNSNTNRVLIGSLGVVPLGYGFFVSGPIYMDLFSGEVSIELSCSVDAKLGVQYTSSQYIRPVKDIDVHEPVFKIKGDIKLGIDAQINVNFLGLVLLAEGAQFGLAGSGEASVPITDITTLDAYCLDVTAYVYFTLYTQIGPDGWCKIYETEVLNKDNSIWRKNLHIEDMHIVDECTRDKGKYQGVVTDAQTGQPIYHAKITLYKFLPLLPEETTFTDSDGVFMGTQQSAGKYKMRVTAGGYEPYECEVQIIGGSTTQIEPQMMVARQTTDDGILKGVVSGRVTDAMTGSALSGVQVSVYTCALPHVGQRINTANTNSSGNYSLTLTAGVYEVVYTKEGYIPNGRYVVVVGDRNDINVSLNPENQSAEINNLRAVLHWGSTPRDLDSHLVGPQNGGRFHIYFSEKNSLYANLDVDITTGYGPETTTITKSSSSAMSFSGAYIDLYNGNDFLYRIQVPTGQAGTLWHVFDYDGETKQITLVHNFSYQSSPSAVGSSGYSVSRGDNPKDLKPYAMEE